MPPWTDTRSRLPAAPRTQWAQVTPLVNLGPRALGVMKRVREIAGLPTGWDGHGSPALREPAKGVAAGLVSGTDLESLPTPHISPVPGGGLQFEWHVGPRELEIEVLPDGSIEYLAVPGEEEMIEGVLDDTAVLDTLFRWLMQC